MEDEKIKVPYKLFAIVLSVVTIITFFIINYNPVSITFIFFSIKVPLTLLFFILLVLGAIVATIYWRNKYNKLKKQLDRAKKLLAVKEQIYEQEENNNGVEV